LAADKARLIHDTNFEIILLQKALEEFLKFVEIDNDMEKLLHDTTSAHQHLDYDLNTFEMEVAQLLDNTTNIDVI
jgi:hypothetical protein